MVEILEKLKKVVRVDNFPTLEQMYIEDNDRYKNLKAVVDDKAREIFMAKEKVDQFNKDVDDLAAWLTEMTEKYRTLEPVAVEAEKVKEQLNEHQVR